MKKFIVVSLAMIFSISCFSERNLSSLIKNLRKCGVDSIITLKVIEGGIWGSEKLTNDTCSPTGYYNGVYINNYVIWKKEGKCYFTKTHPCINYKPMLVNCLPLFLFIDKNISEFRKEYIYPENYGTSKRIFHEDVINKNVNIYVQNKVIHFEFNQTDLKKEYNPKFYIYNLQLKQIEFTRLFIEKLRVIDIGNEHKTGLFLW